jgi:hypothetical protein
MQPVSSNAGTHTSGAASRKDAEERDPTGLFMMVSLESERESRGREAFAIEYATESLGL